MTKSVDALISSCGFDLTQEQTQQFNQSVTSDKSSLWTATRSKDQLVDAVTLLLGSARLGIAEVVIEP